jgi:hypothetical protein
LKIFSFMEGFSILFTESLETSLSLGPSVVEKFVDS